MNVHKNQSSIKPGMKVSVRRSNRDRIGVAVRVEGDYVIIRWTNSDLAETEEYHAHRNEAVPLAGWL